MVEAPGGARINYDQLPSRAQALITEIREHHKKNKLEKLRNRFEECREIKHNLRPKYAELIELVREAKPNGVTHFRLSRGGDVVFINNRQFYGQTFKRLWSLHLPLC